MKQKSRLGSQAFAEADLIDRATSVYYRQCRLHGWLFDQPERSASYVAGDQVTLHNGIIPLAQLRSEPTGLRLVWAAS